MALFWIMVGSLIGNFVAGGLAKLMGYRRAIALMLAGYFVVMWFTFSTATAGRRLTRCSL